MIDRISDPKTPWLEILCKYGFSNKPFILESWSTASWKARNEWVEPDGTPNLKFLKTNYGKSDIPVHTTKDNYETKKFEEYISNLSNPDEYLKDWHFQKEYGTSMYSLHPFFSRDFVNCEDWTSDPSTNPLGDDYRFFYFGGKGTWTKFHSDVVSSHSWSANICGRKMWYMMPPGKEKLFETTHGYVEDIREMDCLFENAEVQTFIQEPGEIVFVPSNWYHQVHNLSDTISINHNWINSTNLNFVHEFLERRVIDVEKEIEDCRQYFSEEEFNEKVELVLFADARLNRSKFESLCSLVVESRRKNNHVWKCDKHDEQIYKCMSSDDCHLKVLQICQCSTSMCEKCLGFIESLEFSIASFFSVKKVKLINSSPFSAFIFLMLSFLSSLPFS